MDAAAISQTEQYLAIAQTTIVKHLNAAERKRMASSIRRAKE
jgi:hypothetical protein